MNFSHLTPSKFLKRLLSAFNINIKNSVFGISNTIIITNNPNPITYPPSIPYDNDMSEPLTRALADDEPKWKVSPEAYVIKICPSRQIEKVKLMVFERERTLQVIAEEVKFRAPQSYDRSVQASAQLSNRVKVKKGELLAPIELPEDAIMEQIVAEMNNGVLTLVVPRDVNRIEVEEEHLPVVDRFVDKGKAVAVAGSSGVQFRFVDTGEAGTSRSPPGDNASDGETSTSLDLC